VVNLADASTLDLFDYANNNLITVIAVGYSEVGADSIGREGGVRAVDFPTLNHGRSGTVAYFATVPGEGQDRSSGLARSHDRMLSAPTGSGFSC